MGNIDIELMRAKKLYQSKKFEDSYELYSKLYEENPEAFGLWDKRFFAWAIYRVYAIEINEKSADAIMKVTKLLPQEDCSDNDQPCSYTLCVQNYIYYLVNEGEYEDAMEWCDLLNPEFLNDTPSEYTTKLEKYYSSKSKALIGMEEYDDAIDLCLEALDKLNDPKESGLWFKWRIAKAHRLLEEYDESLEILLDILNVRKDWYVYFDIAQNYFYQLEFDEALKYAISSALAEGDVDKKVNLYLMMARILNDYGDEDESLEHYRLAYSIKKSTDGEISDDLAEIAEENHFDDDEDFIALEKNLREYWRGLDRYD